MKSKNGRTSRTQEQRAKLSRKVRADIEAMADAEAMAEPRGQYFEAWDALRLTVLASGPNDADTLKRLVDAVADVVQASETSRYVRMTV